MSEGLKSKLSKLEAKIQPKISINEEESTLDLAQYEYLCKKIQMTMTPQEIQQEEEESQKYLLEQFTRYQKMTSEEQKQELKKSDPEREKDMAEFKVWLKSEERRQFDIEYQKRFGSKNNVVYE